MVHAGAEGHHMFSKTVRESRSWLCDDYPYNAYPWRCLNSKMYCCLGSTLVSFIFFCFGSKISGFPGPQISKFPDFQTPPTPAPAPDELSDPNLTPLPTQPGIKYVARSPCCDLHNLCICAIQHSACMSPKFCYSSVGLDLPMS